MFVLFVQNAIGPPGGFQKLQRHCALSKALGIAASHSTCLPDIG